MQGFQKVARLLASRKLGIALWGGLLVAAGLVWAFHTWRGAESKPDYQATGRVIALLPPPSIFHASRPVIIIHHDVVPGLMDESMSMPFIAASTNLFSGLRPGDRIAFGMKVTRDALSVMSIQRLRTGEGK